MSDFRWKTNECYYSQNNSLQIYFLVINKHFLGFVFLNRMNLHFDVFFLRIYIWICLHFHFLKIPWYIIPFQEQYKLHKVHKLKTVFIFRDLADDNNKQLWHISPILLNNMNEKEEKKGICCIVEFLVSFNWFY